MAASSSQVVKALQPQIEQGRHTNFGFWIGENLGDELGQKKSGAKIVLAPEIQTVLA